MHRLSSVVAACAALLPPLALTASADAAGAPTMGLEQVAEGMRCTGYTVVKGVDPVPFGVEVLGIVAGDAAVRQPFILVRTSGPEVAASGIGSGFSGSPVWCPGSDGQARIVGAISATVGQYGNDVGLATPIASILGEPVDVPARTQTRAALVRSARPVDSPLTFSGLSAPVARALQAAGAKAGRTVYAAPAAPRGAGFADVPLVPGSSMAVGLSAGDLTSGAIGTVSYVDGASVWGFGHPFDSAGARSLFLQDAYVYDVIDNPIGTADISSYKYAAAGRVRGTLTNDAINAVAGRLGPGPPAFPLTVTARDLDRRTRQIARIQVADETGVGLPTGVSALSQIAPIAAAQLAYNALGGVPSRQSGRMCVRIALREAKAPLRFCNSYVGGGGSVDGLVNGPVVADVATATSLVDGYRYGPLHVKGMAIDIDLRRELRQRYLRSLKAPRVVRRGRRARLVAVVHDPTTGRDRHSVLHVKIPPDAPRGHRALRLQGADPDVLAGGGDALETVIDLGGFFGDDDGSADDTEARTVAQLSASVAGLARSEKVTGRIGRADLGSVRIPGTGDRVGGSARARVVVR